MNAVILPQMEPTALRVDSTQIHNVLLKIGVPPNLLGYSYIIYAMELLLLDPSKMHAITKELYVDIAVRYRSTPSRVERAIRNAINVTWLYGNLEFITRLFINCIRADKGVPTNSLFLSRIYYYISNMEHE